MTKRNWVAGTVLGAIVGSLVLASGCTSSDRVSGRHDGYDRFPSGGAPAPVATAGPAKPAPAPAPVTSGNCRNYVPAAGPFMTVTGLAFPTGDPATSAVLVHQVMPNEVRLGKPFSAEYHVTNLSGPLEEVILFLDNASNLKIQSSVPAGIPQGNKMAWAVGPMGACETKIVKVTAVSDQLGTASNCLSVSYSNVLCAATNVVNPALKLVKTATPQASTCDNIQFTFTVTNTGTGLAENVKINDPLPTGVETLDGKKEIMIPVGNLAAGESKNFTVPAKAARPGRYTNSATATADPDMSTKSETTTTVITKPVLTITPNCEDFEYIGRNIDYEFVVKNTGDGDATRVAVSSSIPGGTNFVKATEGGTANGSNVVWNLGTLKPGESRKIGFTAVPGPTITSAATTATASDACADSVTATCSTEVRGIPAILLEVVDVDDPVEVGTETTYVITVTNQGSANDQNIAVSVTLPPELAYVSSSGPTNSSVAGQRITFAPLPSLAPKANAVWRVQVKAVKAGSIQSAFEMTSKQFPNPVRETEATNLYD